MTPDARTPFSRIIEEHLALKRRNAGLEVEMPLDRYAASDPFDNHPLFKSEEQARLEETLETAGGTAVATLPSPGENDAGSAASADGLWSRSRDFDWGD